MDHSKVYVSRHANKLIDSMLTGRVFRVLLGSKMSSSRTLNDGLPEGYVLVPLFFNLYISDMNETGSRKFGYTDDWVLTKQNHLFEESHLERNRDDALFPIEWQIYSHKSTSRIPTAPQYVNEISH